jgi:predicted RNA-binding protein with PUA-like domain
VLTPEEHRMNYWLMKSEPYTFSIDDLINHPTQTTSWEGVRNYQARNMLRDQMKVGDLALFYHSSTDIPGIVGIVEITKSGYPDTSAWDPHSEYYDDKSTKEHPRWYAVDVRFISKFPHLISLAKLKNTAELANMTLLKKGNRLSVMAVSPKEWKIINNL